MNEIHTNYQREEPPPLPEKASDPWTSRAFWRPIWRTEVIDHLPEQVFQFFPRLDVQRVLKWIALFKHSKRRKWRIADSRFIFNSKMIPHSLSNHFHFKYIFWFLGIASERNSRFALLEDYIMTLQISY